MTYKQYLINEMAKLANNPNVIFLGYNVKFGHQFYGTLVDVPQDKRIEMPVAENLIMGVAIGMALEGYIPIVCIERMDFLWACADQIINHLDKAEELGWPQLKLIIRTCVCGNKPLDPGCQHLGNYQDIFSRLLKNVNVHNSWDLATVMPCPQMIIERRDDYEKDYIA